MYEKAHWVTWNPQICHCLCLRHCHASAAFGAPLHTSANQQHLLLNLFQKLTCQGFRVAMKGKCNSLNVKKLQNCEDSRKNGPSLFQLDNNWCHVEATNGFCSFFNLIPGSDFSHGLSWTSPAETIHLWNPWKRMKNACHDCVVEFAGLPYLLAAPCPMTDLFILFLGRQRTWARKREIHRGRIEKRGRQN